MQKDGNRRRRGRPKAEWQRKLLTLKNHEDKEITLTQLEQMTGQSRLRLSQTLTRLVESRRESVFQTKDLYLAIKEKLEEGG